MKPTSVLTLSLFFLIAGPSTAWAVPCDPDNNCQNCADQGARLKCKFDRMANRGKRHLELMESVADLLTPAQSQGVTKAKERIDREKGRLASDDFKLLTKKKSKNCQLVEVDGDGIGNDDGVCEKNEDCLEVDGDGIGNDDGICWPLNGKKREVCAQICDEEAVLLDEGAEDPNSVAELEGMYDTLADHLEEVNETVPETAALVNMLRNVTLDDPCFLQTDLQRHSYDAYKKAKWAAMGARAGTDVAERFCDQTIGFWISFTVGAACIVAEGVVTGLNTWWDTVKVVEDELDAITLDATINCARQAANGSIETGEMIDSVQQTLTDVRGKNQEILRLIKISPGQREDYPTP